MRLAPFRIMQNEPKQTARTVRPDLRHTESAPRTHPDHFRALYAVSSGVSGSARGEVHALCPPLGSIALAVALALLLWLVCAPTF